MTKPPSFISFLKIILFIIIAAYLTQCSVENKWSLYNEGNWFPTKYFEGPYSVSLIGGHGFYFGRQALALNKLNLGTWHAYHDLIYEGPTPTQPLELSLELEMGKNSIFYLDLGRDQNLNRWVLRVSRHPDFLSGFIQVDKQGKFTHFEKVSSLPSLNTLNVFIKYSKNQIQFFIEDNYISTLHQTLTWKQLRLKNAFEPVNIQKISIRDLDGKMKIIDFTPKFYWPYFFMYLCLALITNWYINIYFNKKSAHKSTKQIREQNYFFITCLCAFILSLQILIIFDRYFWRQSYFVAGISPAGKLEPNILTRIESLRQRLFNPQLNEGWEWNKLQMRLSDISVNAFNINFLHLSFSHWESFVTDDILGGSVDQTFRVLNPLDPPPSNWTTKVQNAFRIGFLGTSQTWGAGAKSTSTWANLSAWKIGQISQRPTLAINYSIPGTTLTELINIRWEQIKKLPPHILIINLGANDQWHNQNIFINELRTFLKQLAELKIQIVLCTEPFSPDSKIKSVFQNQILELAKENNLLSVDLVSFFQSPEIRDSGFIWNDFIHFSNYGHQILADKIVETLKPLIPKIKLNN